MAFKLDPEPTFQAEVRITVPGGGYLPLPLVFHHKTRSQLDDWVRRREQTDQEMFEEIVHDAPSRPDGLTVKQFMQKLSENYPAAAMDVYSTYRFELQASRAKN